MGGARGPNPEPGEGGGGTNRDKLICFARLGQAGGAGSALAVQGHLVGHRGPVCARALHPLCGSVHGLGTRPVKCFSQRMLRAFPRTGSS